MADPGYTPEQRKAGLERLARDLADPLGMALRETQYELDELRELVLSYPQTVAAPILARRLETTINRITQALEGIQT